MALFVIFYGFRWFMQIPGGQKKNKPQHFHFALRSLLVSQEKSVTNCQKAEYWESLTYFCFSFRDHIDCITTTVLKLVSFAIFRVRVDFLGLCFTERQTASMSVLVSG